MSAHRRRQPRRPRSPSARGRRACPGSRGRSASRARARALAQRRDPERPVLVRHSAATDTEPAEVDQPKGHRTDPLAVERIVVHVLRHRLAQAGKPLAEEGQPVELGLLLLEPERVAVEVLAPPGRVDSGRLDTRVRPRRDANLAPGRRDDETLDPSQLDGVVDALPARVDVAEPAALPKPPPSPLGGHEGDVPRPGVANPANRIAAWTRARSSCSKVTRPGRNCSKRRSACSLPTSSGSSSPSTLRPLAREPPAQPRTGVVHEAARGDAGARARAEGGDDHPGGHGRRRLAERILREEIGGRVIVRTGRRIPGVVPLGGVHAPISVVRMAVGDAYGAKEWREGDGDDEVAFRTERIERAHLPRRRRVRVPPGRAQRARRCSAAPSTPSARCTRGCSRRRWTPPRRATPTSATSHS